MTTALTNTRLPQRMFSMLMLTKMDFLVNAKRANKTPRQLSGRPRVINRATAPQCI